MRRTGAQSGRGAGELESCVPRAPEAGSLVRRWQLRWFVWGDWRFLDPSSRIFSAVDLSFLQCGGALGRRRRRVWWQQWDPKETPDGFEDEKQSLVPAKPLSSPSFSLFLRAVASAAELQPAAEEEQWAVVEVELAPALLTPPPLALEPVSPPPAVLEVEQGPTWAPAGVGAA
ncbi:uncharacterized protein LOC131402212 isoform X2 [Diceros bicornis minor]|uniref:uncharacterized protein LOC131402212 isoform X2 n=1 Tax=Diceros bicornis minor TaxID=77932 RepID=UPI0026F1DB7E|nr:uncharacterized protein LOC131402212 isoform X2 [Diceros bicornis minor]